MYGSYASTILALRAKSSFFYAHPSLSHHRTQSSCCSCCCCCCSSHSSISSCEFSTGFPLYGVSVSPSFVYGYYLPLSSLIPRATPSRRLRRVSCGSDGRFLEMIGLLAEAKGCFREFDREESLYSENNWDEEVEVEKSCNGDQKNLLSRNGDRRKSLRKESNAGRKRNGSSSDYRSETSVGWSADSEVKEGRCGRINGESSSNYWNRVDEVEKEVQEVRKYEDNAWSGREELDSRKKSESRERNSNARALSSSKVHKWKVRDREEDEEDDLLVDLERGVRAEYVRGDQRVIEQSESRGGSRKVERMAKLRKDDGERVYRRMDSARDAREGYRGEEQRAVGQQVLRDGSCQVMRISEVHKDDIERPFRSTDSTHEVREEYVRGQKGVVGQRGSREEESRRVVRIAEIHEDDQKRDSRSMDSTHKSREEYVRKQRHDIGQRESRAESWRTSRISEMREDDTEQASTIRIVADSRAVDKDASPTSAVRQHSHVDQQVVGHTRSDRSSQNLTDVSEIHDSNIERASCTQRHFEETRMKGSEDVSSSIQITKDQKTRINIQEMEKIDLNRQHEYNVNITTANVSDTGKASSSWSHGDTTVGDHEGYTTTSSVNLVCGMREQQNQTSEQVVQQSRSKKESGRTTNLSQIARSNTKRISDSQETSITRIENRNENSSLVFSHDRSKETRTVTGESSQSSKTQTAYSASLSDSSQSSKTRTAYNASLSDNPSSIHINIRELDDEISRDDIYPGKDDVMESASRLDKSSAHYVGEFVNKLEQQLLASDTSDNTVKQYSEAQMEETQRQTTQLSTELLGGLDVTTKNKDKKLIQESARQSSSRSGPKGTYDEMGDVRGISSEESSCRTKPEEDALPGEMVNSNASDRTESAITRRAHRSLWTYIADIIRKGWHPNAETQHSTLKSGTRSSSNESISSEAWFSGHEADENEDEMLKKGSNGTLKEPVLDNRPANYSPVSIQKGSEAPGLGYKVSLLEAGTSTSSGSMRRGPAGGSSQLEHLSWIEGESGKQGAPLAATVIQSSSLTSIPASATVEEAITEIQRHRSESAKLGDELIGEKLTEYVGTEEKDGELKRRKLQRNKQVLKEQFDEWEEAYMRENEQRKVDESFMREALLEAKKAADIWEVPVGAVLVQNGKIIARGCNLVEKLRDSTAHAEMICIREASNVLRTWRLAETTLYVTLEPCPMCAGAILQARIDTVVWGAPNKLLGADGSWVRLFPGDGGSNGLDPSNQAGPVHPFHPNITLRRGILATECADVMQQFFQLRRKKIKKPEPSPPSCLPISTYPTKLLTKMHNIFCMMFCL